MLQAHGAGLWKERNATISFLLSDNDSAGSSACNQEFVGCHFKESSVGSWVRAADDVSGSNDCGIWFSFVGVRYTLATRFTSRHHFRSQNLIVFPLSR